MAQEDMKSMRRLPAIEKNISDISKEDVRISLLGTILDKKGQTIVLDDGTGQVQITFSEPVKEEAKKLVRVIGKVIPLQEDFEIQGEVIQDMSGLDMELYKKVREMER